MAVLLTSQSPPTTLHDYKPLEHPEKRPRSMCGTVPWVLHVEKSTEERRQRKDQDARTVCKRCYDTAMRYCHGVMHLKGSYRARNFNRQKWEVLDRR